MRIHTSHRSARITPFALAFVTFFGACDAPGESMESGSDEPQSTRVEASAREAEPDAVIPASPETLALTDGVVSWKVYDEEAVRIVGADADERAIVELQFQVDHDESGELLGVTVQTDAPDGGAITFDANGQLREDTLTGAQGRLFEALAADIQAAEAGSELQPRGWLSCGAATLKLPLVCASAVGACAQSFGLACWLGGAECYDALLEWMCACKGEHC